MCMYVSFPLHGLVSTMDEHHLFDERATSFLTSLHLTFIVELFLVPSVLNCHC
eukprot:m.62918 g.62918  ORF g.62918 m.62918 type:complete len:53 (+) comp11931_c0_seq5:3519-3677(+)